MKINLYETFNSIVTKNNEINSDLKRRGDQGTTLMAGAFQRGQLIFERTMQYLRTDVANLGASSFANQLPEWRVLSAVRLARFERITQSVIEDILVDQQLCQETPDLLMGDVEILDTGDGMCLCSEDDI